MNIARPACFLTLFVSSVAPLHAGPTQRFTPPPDPILGKWLWHGQNPVSVLVDGKAISEKGETAKWKFLENKELERKYEFVWNGGVLLQRLKLSRDGKKLEGTEKNGARVWAERRRE